MSEWESTNELRHLDVSDHMTNGYRLQQRWKRFHDHNTAPFYEYEWRDVPTVKQE